MIKASLKMALCFFLAWMITNGWSYIFLAVGYLKDIPWMLKIALGYQAFLWLPVTPEKLITIPIAVWINLKVFKDEKTAKLLNSMKDKAVKEWRKIRSRRR